MSNKRCSDQQLIELRNSKLSNSEIARQLGVHKSNVTRRLKKLAGEGVPRSLAILPNTVAREPFEMPLKEQIAIIQSVLATAKVDLDLINAIIERNQNTAGPRTKAENDRQKLQLQRERLILEALKARSYEERDVAIITNALNSKAQTQKFIEVFVEEVGKLDDATRDRIAMRIVHMRDNPSKYFPDKTHSKN